MSLRRLISTLLVLAATFAPAAPAIAEDNKVTLINETDGARIFQLSIDLQRITEGPVTDQNVAQAYSSCEDCRTIAVAIQVLLLMDDIQQVAPVNLAESINYDCISCESLAYAGQLVLSTGGKVRLTADARRHILEITRALNELENSDAPLFEIYAEIDRLADDLKQTVIDGLVGIGAGSTAQALEELGGDTDADAATGADAASSSAEADGGTTGGELPVVTGDGTDAGEPSGGGDQPTVGPTGTDPVAAEPSLTTAEATPGDATTTTTAPAATTTTTTPDGSSTSTATETTTAPAPSTSTTTSTTDTTATTDTTTTTDTTASAPGP